MFPSTGSPPHARLDQTPLVDPVSPPTSLPTSRSSTPGISSLDGTPRYLHYPSFSPSSLPPPPPPPSPPPPPPHHSDPISSSRDMAVESLLPPVPDYEHSSVKARALLAGEATPRTHPDSVLPVPSPSPPPAPLSSVPCLSRIARTLRLGKYQARKSHQLQHQLHFLQLANARTARLIHAARSVHRTLAEAIRSEDRQSFTNLFNAFHDASHECGRTSAAALGEQHCDPDDCPGYPGSYLEFIPPSSRDAVLDLLAKVRHDGAFLADRLVALSPKELLGLLPDRSAARSGDSVLGSSSWSGPRPSRHLGFVVDTQTELLSSCDFGSPLETLLHSLRGVSDCDPSEDRRALDVWSAVCARLVSEQRPGSEKLVPAVLDLWAPPSEWHGKVRLELWILQTLQSGAFLVEQPSKLSFRVRVQGRPEDSAEDEEHAEAFYAQAVNSLLDLLGDPTGASVIPGSVLNMCRAIWRKLEPRHQRAFPHFVVTRWLSTFVFDAVTLPEAHGMLTDCYVSDNARQRVLREIANRTQKTIFDVAYSWKYGNVVTMETTSRVQAIMSRVQDFSRNGPPPTQSHRSHSVLVQPMEPEIAVVISASDVVTLIKALYPHRRPASLSSDQDVLHSGLLSSASSVSGFSMFNIVGSLEHSGPHPSPGPPDSFHAASSGSLQPGLMGAGSLSPGGPNEPLTWSDPDSDQLQEARATLEDLLATGSASLTELWATLTARPGSSTLCTTGDALSAFLSRAGEGKAVSVGPSESGLCNAAVRQLLVESSELEAVDIQAECLPYDQRLGTLHRQLVQSFERRVADAEDMSDFVEAHRWSRRLHELEVLWSRSGSDDILHSVLEAVERQALGALSSDGAVLDFCEAWLGRVKPPVDSYARALLAKTEACDRMRNKMWFVADVRTSAPYDEARSIAGALRVMAKPKKPSRTRNAPPLRHWSGTKFTSTSLHLKTEAQILELLSTSPEHGGPNKLSDAQAKATSLWMERNNIENLCRGEERLHKLCMEIRKCADLLTATESAVVWSNPLFARDKLRAEEQATYRTSPSLAALQGTFGRFNPLSVQTHVAPSIDAMSNISHPLSSASSRDHLDTRSPALTSRSSVPFWSPTATDAPSPSSATSVGSVRTPAIPTIAPRKPPAATTDEGYSDVDKLRQSLISMLLSDLAPPLFGDGSETDRAFWTGLGGELTERHIRSLYVPARERENTVDGASRQAPAFTFDFDQAFAKMLRSFSLSHDPSAKLAILHDIHKLLPLYASEMGSLSHLPRHSSQPESSTIPNLAGLGSSDVHVEGFHRLFCDRAVRPPAIFRDLQYIAALVPTAVLEQRPAGKAFWAAAVAISGLKQELRTVMVETADSIIAYHSNNRGHGRTAEASPAQRPRDSATFATPSRTPPAEDIARHGMAEAAALLQITAREGEAAAQRELATLYLTHPELMAHLLAPFARPRDVFKEELERPWRRNRDPARCDPATMCVAHHWMSLGSKGGDALAQEYLRQREEMERLP